ncbi:MAG: sulfite exporter TauE/SafE family protein [Gammaproteobacteria bacterium]|nr:sulfite exporter TauE/SafE family protein [Gammaproteobacteria bacterium]NBT43332.1 sulfite exporter TauE/SafE family protein [Gammaproteobacteria bacterium]NBY21902.1 sulfite exporter TauE/SafE family protein [Gammaproteobacteria bacterium]
MSYLFLFIAACMAFSISAICGGGAGLLLIPVLGTFLTVSHVPAALTIGTASNSLSRLWMFSDSIRWALSIRFVPMSLLGATVGAELLKNLEPMYVELCMGVFLVSNLPDLIRKPKNSDGMPTPKEGWQVLAIGGLAGIISALTGAVGVLFNRFYMRHGLSPQEIIATRAANEILLHGYKLFLYYGLGLFDLKTIEYGALVAIASIISSRFMRNVLPHLSPVIFSRIGISAMVLVGVVMLNGAVLHIRSSVDPSLKLNHLAEDFEATLTWNKLIYSLEFNYGEGFEFEQVVPLASLSLEQQEQLSLIGQNYDHILLEKVTSLSGEHYEANIFGPDQKLIKTVEIN